MENQPKVNLQKHLENPPNEVDVFIRTIIVKGTNGVILSLPNGRNRKLPSFLTDMLVSTTFEVKKFSTEFPSVEINQDYRSKSIYASGTSADKITATFKFEYLLISNFSSNPTLEISISKNPYDLSGKKPYLEIVAAKWVGNGKFEYYQPIKGFTEFGDNKINLFINPIPEPNIND